MIFFSSQLIEDCVLDKVILCIVQRVCVSIFMSFMDMVNDDWGIGDEVIDFDVD